jgi:hypothetical protein
LCVFFSFLCSIKGTGSIFSVATVVTWNIGALCRCQSKDLKEQARTLNLDTGKLGANLQHLWRDAKALEISGQADRPVTDNRRRPLDSREFALEKIYGLRKELGLVLEFAGGADVLRLDVDMELGQVLVEFLQVLIKLAGPDFGLHQTLSHSALFLPPYPVNTGSHELWKRVALIPRLSRPAGRVSPEFNSRSTFSNRFSS